jgi:hypothetical protein
MSVCRLSAYWECLRDSDEKVRQLPAEPEAGMRAATASFQIMRAPTASSRLRVAMPCTTRLMLSSFVS